MKIPTGKNALMHLLVSALTITHPNRGVLLKISLEKVIAKPSNQQIALCFIHISFCIDAIAIFFGLRRVLYPDYGKYAMVNFVVHRVPF